jgi:hypothetical protein
MNTLGNVLAFETAKPVPADIGELASHLAGRQPGALCVLAYGSALRESSPSETLIDFYVLVEHPAQVSANPLLRLWGRAVPPNVYFFQEQVNGTALRAKYAVMTMAGFERRVGASTSNPYFWARFCQPCRIVWVLDEPAKAKALAAIATACQTAYAHGVFLSPGDPWPTLFSNTYRTELRPENTDRATLIVEADRSYYDSLSEALSGTKPIASSWRAKRIWGKAWSVARLAKAAFTFQGGADYAAWKIARHSGVKMEVTDWQRKHPFLAAIILMPKILRSKALK